MYYNKYLKYKKKYLQLKNQLGGISFCEKAYRNLLGTCWMASILTMFTFGQATSNHLKSVIERNNKNFISFVRSRITELQSNPQLMNFYPGILDDGNRIFFENIINKFIDRYDSKISSRNKKPENIDDLTNPQRCELVIAQNFKKLFNHPIIRSHSQSEYGTNLAEQYLFTNLLSVFFFNEKVSFKNYYNNFNLIKFDPENDLGILMNIKGHVCCLYICDGMQRYYNDNNKQVYNCLWQSILKRSTNLFIKEDSNFKHIDSYENKENLQKVLYLTVISKHPKNSVLDQEIENMLKYDFSSINDMQLQLILGEAFYSDKGVGQDYKEAARWYRLAADQGNSKAQNSFGIMFLNGLGVAQDDAEAVRWWRLAADQKDADAQYNLGYMVFSGLGVAENKEEAVRLFRLAAAQGHTDAQNRLGSMYLNGNGVAQDDAEAARLYRLAAEQGNAEAQYNLGFMFANGQGVAQDYTKAAQLFRLAADQEDADAQYKLGLMFWIGEGVAQDYTEAARLYHLAAEQGNADAQYNLGSMFYNGQGVAQDHTEAARLYRLAVEQGHTDAQYILGSMFYNGKGVAQDHTEAARLYRLAADKGNVNSQYILGSMFYNGKGVAKDMSEAVRLFHLAAAQGHTDAQKVLKILT